MQKTKFIIRYFFTVLLYLFNLLPLQKKNIGKIINVINFHYFLEKHQKPIDPSIEVNIDIFEKQLSILSKKFNIISTKKNLDNFFLEKNNYIKNNKHNLILTIDDADYNFLRVLPIIEKFKIKVLLFAPIGFCLPIQDIVGIRSRCLHFSYLQYQNENLIKNKETLLELFNKFSTYDYEYLNKIYSKLKKNNDSFFIKKNFLSISDLNKIAKHDLVTVSSHSMSHVPLALLPKKWINWEIKESLKYIQECGGNLSLFSYPYGNKNSFNNDVKKCLQLHGVNYAFTTRAKTLKKNSNHFELGRTFLFNNSHLYYVKATARGANQIFDQILNR